MDNRTLVRLRSRLRTRSNKYMFSSREGLSKEEESVLDGRIEELEDIIQLLDKELLSNPSPETLMSKKSPK